MGKPNGLCHLNWQYKVPYNLLTSRCVIIVFITAPTPGAVIAVFTRKGGPAERVLRATLVTVETESWVTEGETSGHRELEFSDFSDFLQCLL